MSDKRGTKLKEFKGYAVYVTEGGRFRAYMPNAMENDDPVLEAGTLSTLQDKLKDRAALAVANVKALVRHDRGGWHSDEELSYDEVTLKNVRVVSGRNRYRTGDWDSGYYDNELIKPIPKNRERIARLTELYKQRKGIEAEESKLEKALEHYTDEELLGVKKP